ncbi:hypothetical protein CFBP5875_18290 [Agrobacterium pusense]|nr:hypothetical protein CFBP5875_18290 [Agrobacterium pusense]
MRGGRSEIFHIPTMATAHIAAATTVFAFQSCVNFRFAGCSAVSAVKSRGPLLLGAVVVYVLLRQRRLSAKEQQEQARKVHKLYDGK